MSEVKTVTHEGKVYQIGSVYEFSDGGKDWEVDDLVSVVRRGIYPFESRREEWKLIRKVNSTIGTITPEPIELIDGDAYMFSYRGDEGIGLYEEDESLFFMVGCSYNLEDCTNIRHMTVTESK